jgi:hypothetical protein
MALDGQFESRYFGVSYRSFWLRPPGNWSRIRAQYDVGKREITRDHLYIPQGPRVTNWWRVHVWQLRNTRLVTITCCDNVTEQSDLSRRERQANGVVGSVPTVTAVTSVENGVVKVSYFPNNPWIYLLRLSSTSRAIPLLPASGCSGRRDLPYRNRKLTGCAAARAIRYGYVPQPVIQLPATALCSTLPGNNPLCRVQLSLYPLSPGFKFQLIRTYYSKQNFRLPSCYFFANAK